VFSLGLKQLGEDPWVGHLAPLSAEHAFVRQGHQSDRLWCIRRNRQGIEGLVHVQKWTGPTDVHPSKGLFNWATEVEVMILEIDEERRRISSA